MDEKNINELEFEDISSTSTPKKDVKKVAKKAAKKVAKEVAKGAGMAVDTVKKINNSYGNGVFKHIDKVIKLISFVLAIGVLLLFAAVGAVLIFLDKAFVVLAIGVFIIGIVMAIITLFLVYSLGHIISQNNEILNKQ